MPPSIAVDRAAALTDSYVDAFRRLQDEVGDPRESFLPAVRRAAMDRFLELGFPTTRNEEWKYTNVTPIARTSFRDGDADGGIARGEFSSIERSMFGGLSRHLLVFVNGKYRQDLSSIGALPRGVSVRSLREALSADTALLERDFARYASFRENAFTALNTAFVQDGAVLQLLPGAVVEEPVCLLHVSAAGDEPVISFPRVLILAGENSQATVVEGYAGAGPGVTFANAVTEVVVGQNAVLDHYKVQRYGDQSYHVAMMHAQLSQSSNFSSHSFSFGGGIARNDVRVVLGGEGGECTLNGLYLVTGQQLVDNHTAMDHAQPHCDSHEVYHGVLDGRGTGVFNGKILVRPRAQKTDAKQTNRTLLLSEDAVIDSKPQLEIFADDVKCTHGATVGHLDEEALFYLRTRGIPQEDAASLLTFAFANEIVDRVKVSVLQERLREQIFDWLARAQGAGAQETRASGSEVRL